jgi:adenylate cyclase
VNQLSEHELANAAGTTVDQVRRLVELGILNPTAGGGHQPSDIQRIRILEALDQVGIAPEQIGQLIAGGSYSMGWAALLFPDPTPRVGTTLDQAVAEHELPRSLVAGLYAAWELARPEPGRALRADDAELLRLAVLGYSAFGRDETLALGVARQLGGSLRRLAESQIRLFRDRIQAPMAAEGGSPQRTPGDAIAAIAASLLDALERTVLLLYRRHLEVYVLDAIVLNAETSLERVGLAQARPERPPAIAFLDLTGYTTLTDRQGDRAAAELAARLVEVAHLVSQQHGGRLVKLLGDGVMFYFPDPAQAVLCGLELVERIPREGLPNARMGVDAGPVVFQDGDYFGSTVDVAARITDYARPGEVLVSDDVVTESPGTDGAHYRPLGPIALKGVTTPVTLHTAVRSG